MQDINGRFLKGTIPWNKGQKLAITQKGHCLQCRQDLVIYPWMIKWKRGQFCNRACRTSYQIGKPPLPRGWKHTNEAKRKIGQASKGHKVTEKIKQIISIKNSGENNGAWKGGVSFENHKARRCSKYKKWRRDILKRDNYTCQKCGAKDKPLEADHIKPFATYLELRFILDNGRTLCIDCHKQTDTWGFKKVTLDNYKIR